MAIYINYSDYIQSFPLARSLNRRWHFYLGPTNSGKTYEALEALKQSNSGVYLAPLRLLAMEVRDRLQAAGVPCNLITGEERQLIDGARHTASTIEMMQVNHVVDVAVIDEIQMLQDADRGCAWTEALVGVPAKVVYVCGSNAVTQPCLNLLEHLNEPFTLHYLERKTPLVLEQEALCGKKYSAIRLKAQLQTGDAIIAFSRQDVLTLSARIRNWGFKVATIYGALSPEVRRIEAERFLCGEAEIIIATDAIGMGLNLPIRRVIFSSVQKFDGIASRLLNATEVRQIAGRAGRFGIYPTGFVAAFEQDEIEHLSHMLTTSDIADLRTLPIAPSWAHIDKLSNIQFSNRLGELLEYFEQSIMFSGNTANLYFTLSPNKTQIALAHLIDSHAPNLALRDKFILSCAPTSLTNNFDLDYFLICLQSIDRHKIQILPKELTWLTAKSPKYLARAEKLTRDISLYAWLSFKFPSIFVEANKIHDLRRACSLYTAQALLTQAGFAKISKEFNLHSVY